MAAATEGSALAMSIERTIDDTTTVQRLLQQRQRRKFNKQKEYDIILTTTTRSMNPVIGSNCRAKMTDGQPDGLRCVQLLVE